MTDLAPTVVTLSRPVSHGKEVYSTITFSEPVMGRDLVAMDAVQGETRRNYAMLASMAGVPLQVFLGMTLRDIGKVQAAASARMGESGEAEGVDA